MPFPPVMFVDSHCHVPDRDADALVRRACAAGVSRLVCCGTRPQDWPLVQDWARAHAAVLPCFGLHPWHAGSVAQGWVEELERFLDAGSCALGEAGLDAGRGPAPQAQEEALRIQLRLAARRGLPVMLHCVRAWARMEKLLAQEPPSRGFLLHAYGGPAELMEPLARKGAYFSFAPFQFRRKGGRFLQALRAAPAKRLLFESDAPDPEDPRGSEALPELARAAALLRKEDARALAERCLENARNLLGDLFRGASQSSPRA